MNTNWKISINKFLTKAILLNLNIFAFSIFISKKLTNVSGIFICLFGLLQMIILGINPLKNIKDKTLNLPILVFSLAMFLSFIGHPYPEVFFRFVKHILIFLFFYTIIFNLQNFNHLKKVIAILSFSMFISAVYGAYQHFVLKIPRVEGFSFILSFGCFVAIFFIFLIVYAIWGENKTSYRFALFTGSALMGANLLFTQARGAWLGFLGGLFTLTWIKNKKIIAPFLIVCLLLYFILPQIYIDRFKSSFNIKDNNSNLTRIALWKSALLMYRDHIINGVGLDRFEEEYKTNYKQPYNVSTYCHAHNNILNYMAEAGTFGLIAFIWLMVIIVIWLYKNYSQISDPKWRLFPLASLCGVIIFNIQGLTEFNYTTDDTGRFFWLLIALNVAIDNLCKKESILNN